MSVKTTVTIGEQQLDGLNVPQVCNLIEEVWDRQRTRLLIDLNDVGATAERREEVLVQHTNDRGVFAPLIRHALTYAGACEIITLAGGDLEALNGVGVRDLNVAASNLIGVDIEDLLERARQKEESGATPPDPTLSAPSPG